MMNNNKYLKTLLVLILTIFVVLSYGFIDPNLTLTNNSFINSLIAPFYHTVYENRLLTAGMFSAFLGLLFYAYVQFLKSSEKIFLNISSVKKYVLLISAILIFSYPALSYDLFNYITTAKVLYTHHENPYVVMPIEIPNDPNLAFTRAANKLALYGPTWLLVTWIPHTIGLGNIWQTIVAFKLITTLSYLVMCFLIWRITKKVEHVIFFAFNPLVLIEILVSGHNDIVMMTFVLLGLLLWQQKAWMKRIAGLCLIILSIFVKGATVVLVPLLFFRQINKERLMLVASCLLFLVFLIAAPLREELYPWYAVWFLSAIAFLPYKKYRWLWEISIALSLGLELRHIPYMAMGYYEGPGPLLRTVLTIIPVAVWGIWRLSNFQFSRLRSRGRTLK